MVTSLTGTLSDFGDSTIDQIPGVGTDSMILQLMSNLGDNKLTTCLAHQPPAKDYTTLNRLHSLKNHMEVSEMLTSLTLHPAIPSPRLRREHHIRIETQVPIFILDLTGPHKTKLL